MSFTYKVDLGEREFVPLATGIRVFTAKLVRLHPTLRGLRLEHTIGGSAADPINYMIIALRITGLTRWNVQHDAPRLLSILLRKFEIPTDSVTFESMIMEPGRSWLKQGQGRTEMTRRPRAERMADGRPWDHIAWEGDELTDEEP